MSDFNEQNEQSNFDLSAKSLVIAPSQIRWQDLKFSEKLMLFDLWSFGMLLSNVLSFTGSSLLMFNFIVPLVNSEFIIAIGCFLAWVTLFGFLSYSNQYSFLSRTLKKAGTDIGRTVVATMPFFLGFTFLGISLFWETYRFHDPSISLFTLFALMHGDEIVEIFRELTRKNFIVGYIYIIVWVSVSVFIIINLFLIIIEDSYMEVKSRHKDDWIKKIKKKAEKVKKKGGQYESSSSSDETEEENKSPEKLKSMATMKALIM